MITNQYTYNGDGQRVQIVDSQGTKKQIWDGENILLETDGANATQVVYTNEPAGYGNLVSQRRGSTTSYYLFDALGSTRKLTNAAGSVTDSYDYRAYGETYAATAPTTNVFRWVGEKGYYFDVDRSAYSLSARHYSPKQGRFLSNDPIGFKGSEWNLYEYVSSSPINGSDPSGQSLNTDDPCGCPQRHPGHAYPDPPYNIDMDERPWYGCYCGTGNGPQRQNPLPSPIDPLDNACQEHDTCWGKFNPPCVYKDRRAGCVRCDRDLCEGIRTASCERYGPGTQEWKNCRVYKNLAEMAFCLDARGRQPPVQLPGGGHNPGPFAR